MSYVAKCETCGVIKRGDLEEVGDAIEDHEQFHDVRIQRVATDGGKAIDASPDVGDRVTYYDSESDPHHALVTWIFGDDPGVGPMINCVRGQDFELGDTDATDGDYGYQVTHETSVQHRERADETHVYVRGWSE
jgi:hypothetical protein